MRKRRSPEEEAVIAEYYEQHKDDPEEWGDSVEPPPEAHEQGLGATVTVRLSAGEAEQLRRLAKQTGRTHSDIIRRAVRAYDEQDGLMEARTTHIVLTAAPCPLQIPDYWRNAMAGSL